ncbi:MAG: hypothetical protein P4M15_11640 [Alphaproteobacteria bacterium]|nr:hypothetical protein [Alphaproteobacteria bacterium]
MRNIGPGSLALAVLLCPFLTACSTDHLPRSPAPVEEAYQARLSPPPGYARIYILPAHYKALLNEGDHGGQVFAGPSQENAPLAGEVTARQFVAFDAVPGRLFIRFVPDVDDYFTTSQAFDVTAGETLMLRPILHDTGLGFGNYGLIGVMAGGAIYLGNSRDPAFEQLDAASALPRIRADHLSSLAPEASSSIRQ